MQDSEFDEKSLIYSNRYHCVQQLKIYIFNWFLGRTDYLIWIEFCKVTKRMVWTTWIIKVKMIVHDSEFDEKSLSLYFIQYIINLECNQLECKGYKYICNGLV